MKVLCRRVSVGGVVSACFLFCLGAGSRPANAQAPATQAQRGRTQEEVRKARDGLRFYEEALKHYKAGEYDAAIIAFNEAYRLTESPELLFNIAQAYRRKGSKYCGEAYEYYSRYQAAEPDPSKRASAAPRLSEMKDCLSANRTEEPPGIDPASRDETAVQDKPDLRLASPVNAPSRPAVELPATTSSGGPSRAAWILSGTGAALLVTGTLLVWSVSWEDGCSPRCSPSQAEGWRTRTNVGYAMWAAGGATAAAGLVLWIRDARKPAATPRAAIAPSLGGLVAAGQF